MIWELNDEQKAGFVISALAFMPMKEKCPLILPFDLKVTTYHQERKGHFESDAVFVRHIQESWKGL